MSRRAWGAQGCKAENVERSRVLTIDAGTLRACLELLEVLGSIPDLRIRRELRGPLQVRQRFLVTEKWTP